MINNFYQFTNKCTFRVIYNSKKYYKMPFCLFRVNVFLNKHRGLHNNKNGTDVELIVNYS